MELFDGLAWKLAGSLSKSFAFVSAYEIKWVLYHHRLQLSVFELSFMVFQAMPNKLLSQIDALLLEQTHAILFIAICCFQLSYRLRSSCYGLESIDIELPFFSRCMRGADLRLGRHALHLARHHSPPRISLIPRRRCAWMVVVGLLLNMWISHCYLFVESFLPWRVGGRWDGGEAARGGWREV